MKLSSLNSGLVGSWGLDSQHYNPATKRLSDSTPNSNHGISANAAVFTTDRMGQADRAMSFDGASDYVDCGNDESLDMGLNDWTISVWAKFGDKTSHQNFIAKYMGVGRYYLNYSNNRLRANFYNGTGYDYWSEGTTAVNDGQWHHIVYVVDRDGYQYLYLDKVIDAPLVDVSGGVSEDVKNSGNLVIAKKSHFFDGNLADVRIYNRALSQQEITQLFSQYRPKLSLGSLLKGLVLDMPLNSKRYNAGNSKFDDLTPYENRGTNNGGDVDTDHTTFNGTSDNVRIPDSESLSPTSAMTAMVWVKGAAQSGKWFLSQYDSGVNQKCFGLISEYASPHNKARILISDDGTTIAGHYKDYKSSIVAFDSTWHLVGFSFDAGTLKLYIDGVEDPNPTKTHDGAITAIYDSTADIMLGCYLNSDTPTGFFNGDISRAKMWNRALTDAEFKLAYDQTKGLYL